MQALQYILQIQLYYFEEAGNVPQRRVTNCVVTDHHFMALITTEWDYSQPPCLQRDQRAAAA